MTTTQQIPHPNPSGGAHLHPAHPRRTEVERAALIGAFTADLIERRDEEARDAAEAAAAAHARSLPPLPDPDATVVIGRHRTDGTTTVIPRRRRFIGRVAAATVGRFRRAGR